jgi:subtilisin family serine protease
MRIRNVFILFLTPLLLHLNSCKPSYHAIDLAHSSFEKVKDFSKEELSNWHLKDIEKDSLPGISLERAYLELLQKLTADTIIVAVLDSEININREGLKEQIWVNKNEIPNNGIDDDTNGYIDDIHGWSYIGTKKNDSVVFSSFAFTRVIAKYDAKFKNSSRAVIPEKDKQYYDDYIRALAAFNKELEYRKSNLVKYARIEGKYNKASEIVNHYLPNSDYNQAQLDSLETSVTDEEEKKYISYMKYYLKHDINNYTINKGKYSEQKIISQNLNTNHNGKYHTKDNPDDITDVPYGSNTVDGIANFHHGTEIASIIASSRNHKDVKGMLAAVKIMCLNTSTAGDEYDKDIALAIRYAADNGAKVINMSFGKAFSLHPEWVKEAVLYAESKNVLIVTSAGNNSINLDQDYDYPNDAFEGKEYANNFLKIGATTYRLDSTLVADYSNYGKNEVDIFAPGSQIDCLTWNRTTKDSGTSLSSAVVSGVAALIFSYYPNLTAEEVKNIIMESGLTIDLMVTKPSNDEEKEKVPFNTLSKSGKIVNAYNALIMADSLSKTNKRKE